MFNIGQIFKNHRRTYYNYATDELQPVWKIILIPCGLALILSFVFANTEKDLIGAVLNVYSILIGFSLNILFYLLSNNKIAVDAEPSRERKNKIQKLTKLGNELFHNVLYFNIMSVILVLIALLYYLAHCRSLQIIATMCWLLPDKLHLHLGLMEVSKRIAHWVYNFIFYFVLIESIFTLIRTIGRVSYYFDQKIKIEG